MNKKSKYSERAAYLFNNGYNCAQSVLLAMCEYWKYKNELIPKIATALGAGIGRCGSLCGALTGGVMAIGIKYGSGEPSLEKRLKAYELGSCFYRLFERENGNILCIKLVGYDLSNPKEWEKAHEEKIFEKKCANYVRNSVRILMELFEN